MRFAVQKFLPSKAHLLFNHADVSSSSPERSSTTVYDLIHSAIRKWHLQSPRRFPFQRFEDTSKLRSTLWRIREPSSLLIMPHTYEHESVFSEESLSRIPPLLSHMFAATVRASGLSFPGPRGVMERWQHILCWKVGWIWQSLFSSCLHALCAIFVVNYLCFPCGQRFIVLMAQCVGCSQRGTKPASLPASPI